MLIFFFKLFEIYQIFVICEDCFICRNVTDSDRDSKQKQKRYYI